MKLGEGEGYSCGTMVERAIVQLMHSQNAGKSERPRVSGRVYIYIHIYTYIQLLSKRPFADLSPFLLGCMSYIVIVLPRNSADGRLQAVFVTPKFPQGGDSEHETRTPKHTEMLYIYCC